MRFIETKISDLIIIEPKIFLDKRGYFFESFKLNEFQKNIQSINFIQDNESKSSKGVLRGLHFQKPPFDQAKLVKCTSGEILDVAVDLRKGSKTYGQHLSVKLSSINKKQLFIPRGFAHGFIVLSNSAIITYKVDNKYSPIHDSGIIWNDKNLNIEWGIDESEIVVSKKDSNLTTLKEFKSPFKI